jgi:hypothetical protein
MATRKGRALLLRLGTMRFGGMEPESALTFALTWEPFLRGHGEGHRGTSRRYRRCCWEQFSRHARLKVAEWSTPGSNRSSPGASGITSAEAIALLAPEGQAA